jgi:hypothetical protein
MGYYIDFVFDAERVHTHEDVVELFMNKGATLFDAYNNDDTIPGGRPQNHIMILHDKISFPIIVYKKEADSLKGNWAHTRMSWGNSYDFQQAMEAIISLADSMGCRVYDGQVEEFVSMDNLEKVMESYFGGASWVRKNIGTVQSK